MATRIVAQLITPNLGFNDSDNTSFVGTRVDLSDGGQALFVKAGSEIAQYAAVAINVDNSAVNLITAVVAKTTGTSRQVGFAQTSLASGNNGFVSLSGRPKVKLASACADQVILFTTATAGVLDDTTVSASLIAGVVSKTTISNATAITVIVGPGGAFVHPFVNPA